MLLAGCEGLFYDLDGLDAPDETVASEDDPRPCADSDVLIYDGDQVGLGAECGPCNSGRIVCDGEDDVRCAAALPDKIGEPCGDCGTWECDGEQLACDDDDFNTCGGCEELDPPDAQPHFECTTDAGDDGTWHCTGPNKIECLTSAYLGEHNPCGGEPEPEEYPGTSCEGPCGQGTYACGDDPDELECINADENDCGGCDTLDAEVGDECGRCGESWECGGEDELACIDESNDCGGCNDLANTPGEACDDGLYECLDPEWVICSEQS